MMVVSSLSLPWINLNLSFKAPSPKTPLVLLSQGGVMMALMDVSVGAFEWRFLTFPHAPCYTEDNGDLLPQGVSHEAGAFA